MLAYLTVESVMQRLTAFGQASKAPPPEMLEIILEDIEALIDGWVGYRIAPTEYNERLTTNRKGVALLKNYPVISVQEVVTYPNHNPGYDPVPIPTTQISSAWRQDRRIGLSAHTVVKVTYTAGYDPIPRDVTQAAWQIFDKLPVGENGTVSGSLSFLNEPRREVQSLSLPGGLSKSFKIAGMSDSSSGSGKSMGSTVLDQMLFSLGKYRRTIVA